MAVTKKYWEEESAQNQFLVRKRTVSGTVETHWHDFYELELVVSGQGVHTVNGERYPLVRGSLYLLTPMDTHAIELSTSARLYHLSISASNISPNLHDNLWGEHEPAQLDERELASLVAMFESLIGESERVDKFHKTVVQNLLELILITAVRSIKVGASLKTMRGLQRAVAYIQSNFTQSISLAEVAAQAGLNRTWFSEVFEREMGRGFSRYLTDLRLGCAKRLLQHEELSIKEICYECGFSSLSAFLCAFRKATGMTPTEFRKTKRSSA